MRFFIGFIVVVVVCFWLMSYAGAFGAPLPTPTPTATATPSVIKSPTVTATRVNETSSIRSKPTNRYAAPITPPHSGDGGLLITQ